MENLKVKQFSFPFRVAMVSSNTNSFGLYQMIVMSKKGEAYKTHASMYNVKKVGEDINLIVTTKQNEKGNDVVTSSYFRGCEMTVKLPKVPKEVLNEVFQ